MVRTNSIDTRHGSPKGHYVNRFVRGFRPPGSRRISSACFGPSRLRMRHIIRPQIILPAIRNPDATHRRHAVRGSQALRDFLIPDCVPARARLANRSARYTPLRPSPNIWRDALRRHHSAPGMQPCGDHFDTGLRPVGSSLTSKRRNAQPASLNIASNIAPRGANLVYPIGPGFRFFTHSLC